VPPVPPPLPGAAYKDHDKTISLGGGTHYTKQAIFGDSLLTQNEKNTKIGCHQI
jgi:hypothetical protein